MENKPQTLTPRAKRFALIIQLLFARQDLTGKLQTVNRGARHLSYGVRLANPMQLESGLKLAEPLALACGVNAVLAQRLEGIVNYQIELPQGFWEYYTRRDLPNSKDVGLAEQRRPIAFELDPPHALIAGTSGAGKSETLKSILFSLMTTFLPAELGVILCDPHNDYTDFHNAAHLVMPIATEAESIRQALAWAMQELTQRKAADTKTGKVIVIAIDEADSVLTGQNLEIAKAISKQARKYRIHLILITQKPLSHDLPGILDNLLNRWVGQLADASTSAKVTGHAGLMAHKLTPKGDFLHITGPDVQRFQVAIATRQDFERLPRAEVQRVDVQPVEVIELPADLPTASPGRPSLQLNPAYLAWYFFHNPEKISRGMAQKMMGLTQSNHELHKRFCQECIKAYLELKQQATKQIGA